MKILKIPRISDQDFRFEDDKYLNYSLRNFLKEKNLEKFQYNWNILKNHGIFYNEKIILLFSPCIFNENIKQIIKKSIIGNFIPVNYAGVISDSEKLYREFIESDENKSMTDFIYNKYESVIWEEYGKLNKTFIQLKDSNQLFSSFDEESDIDFLLIPEKHLDLTFLQIESRILNNEYLEIDEKLIFSLYSGKIIFPDYIREDLLNNFPNYIE